MSNSTIFSTVFDLSFLSFLALLLDSLHHTIGTVLALDARPVVLGRAPPAAVVRLRFICLGTLWTRLA